VYLASWFTLTVSRLNSSVKVHRIGRKMLLWWSVRPRVTLIHRSSVFYRCLSFFFHLATATGPALILNAGSTTVTAFKRLKPREAPVVKFNESTINTKLVNVQVNTAASNEMQMVPSNDKYVRVSK